MLSNNSPSFKFLLFEDIKGEKAKLNSYNNLYHYAGNLLIKGPLLIKMYM